MTDLRDTEPRSPRLGALPALPVLLFLVAALANLGLPGLHMDAVNPEYLLPVMLGHESELVRHWVLPGNLVADRFPVLASALYHGTVHVYFALPWVWLFGLSVESLRLVTVLAGMTILLLSMRLMRPDGRADPVGGYGWIAWASLLAVEPAFVLALRTQAYSVVFSAVLVLPALWLLGRTDSRETPAHWSSGATLAAGVLLGLATFNYFVAGLLIPGVLAAVVLHRWRTGGRAAAIRTAAVLCAGTLLGYAPQFVGMSLIATESGGVGEAVSWFEGYARPLEGGAMDAGYLAGLDKLFHELVSVLGHDWLSLTFFGHPLAGGVRSVSLAGWLLLGIVLAHRLLAQRAFLLRLVAAALGSFFVLGGFIGTRLGGHHLALLVPLLYVAAAVAMEGPGRRGWRERWPAGVATIAFALLAASALITQWRLHEELRATGGKGFYAVALTRAVREAAEDPATAYVALPDWGYAMPFVFLNRRGVEVEERVSPAKIRRAVASGGRARVVFHGSAHGSRFALISRLAGDVPYRVLDYRDGTGAVVAETAIFAVSRPGPADDRMVWHTAADPDPAAIAEPGAAAAESTTVGASPALTLRPDALPDCAFLMPAIAVEVAWNLGPGGSGGEIWVQSRSDPAPVLWTRVGRAGSKWTGPWASAGMLFQLRQEGTDRILGETLLGEIPCPEHGAPNP